LPFDGIILIVWVVWGGVGGWGWGGGGGVGCVGGGGFELESLSWIFKETK